MANTPAYDDVVMDHIKNARNYRELADAEATSGSNPLCGDEIVLYTRSRDGVLEDLAYQCTCCGISMASASIMTELLKGRSAADARARAEAVLATLAAPDTPPEAGSSEGERALLDTIRRFPARTGCAALPWQTLLTATAHAP